MDPFTAIAAATTAYNAIKKGFAAGREVEQMAGDLGRWMNSLNAIKEGHSKAKSRRIGSIEEEALETYAIKKKAEAMENELRNFIISNYGMAGWQDIIRIQAKLRKERQAEEQRRKEQLEEFIVWCMVMALALTALVLGVWVFITIDG
jgi:hypothetical protein